MLAFEECIHPHAKKHNSTISPSCYVHKCEGVFKNKYFKGIYVEKSFRNLNHNEQTMLKYESQRKQDRELCTDIYVKTLKREKTTGIDLYYG